jgi:hypothetical protein
MRKRMSSARIPLVVASIASCVAFDATAAEATRQTLAAECTTKAGPFFEQYSCDSDRTVLHAPAGYVFVQTSLTGGEVSGAGAEHECRVGWDDYVEILPGTSITQPTTVWVQAHALGPSGIGAGRGWAKCQYTVTLTKYR